eukprot:145881_1
MASQQRLSQILGQLKPCIVSNSGDIEYVLITGCSRGIGYGLVESILTEKNGKYYVIATCRSPHKQYKLRTLISQYPNNASLIQLDISNEESIISSISQVITITNHIHILINNAAITSSSHPFESVLDFNSKEMLNIYKTNVMGPALLVKSYINLLKAHSSSQPTKVINIGSTLGSLNNVISGFQKGSDSGKTAVSYRLSKSALNMLTALQAGELGSIYNIIFTCVHPGWVQTDMGSTHNRKAPVTINKSVNGIVNIMENMNMETHNGKFIDFKSQPVPW